VPRLSSHQWQVPCAKFEVDSTNRYLFVAFCCSCMYVTVLVILTFDLLTLDNGRTSRITWSTPPPSLKMSSRSWVMSLWIWVKKEAQLSQRDRATRCQSKSCQLLHNFTKYPIFKGLQRVNDLEGHSRSSELSSLSCTVSEILPVHFSVRDFEKSFSLKIRDSAIAERPPRALYNSHLYRR